MSKNENMCDCNQGRLPCTCKPAMHQGEPVALPAAMHPHDFDNLPEAHCDGWNACLDEIAKLEPLYTHADPGEVARLRDEIERMRERVTPTHKSLIGKHAEIIKERDALRALLEAEKKQHAQVLELATRRWNYIAKQDAQQAEAQALLRSTVSMLYSISARLLDFHADKPEQWCGYLDDALGGTKHQISELEKSISASAEPSAPKFSDNLTWPDTVKIQMPPEEMKRLGLKEPAAPKHCGKVKVVYGHGDYGRCGSDERSPGTPAQCEDCKKSEGVDLPNIVINDDEPMPDIVYDSCVFIGNNADGSAPFTYGKGEDGFPRLVRINFRGWKCYGPMQDAPSAPVEIDERAAFEKQFPSERLARDGDGYANDSISSEWEGWQARAALERKP